MSLSAVDSMISYIPMSLSAVDSMISYIPMTLSAVDSIQIMNVYECNGTNIFTR